MRAWLLLLLVVPLASAQTSFSLHGVATGPDDLVAPLATVSVPVTWTLACATDPQPPPMPQQQARLQWSAPMLPGLTLNGAPSTDVTLPDCISTTSATIDMPILATPMRSLPGLLPTQANLTGTLTWQTPNGPAATTYDTSFQIMPDAYLLLEAKVDVKLKQGSPGSNTTFDFELQSFSNTPIVVGLKDQDGAITLLADPIAPQERRTYTFIAEHDDTFGWDNHEQVYTLEFTPFAAFDPDTAGESVVVHVVARTRTEVGAPGPALPLLVVGLAALAAGKRRKEG